MLQAGSIVCYDKLVADGKDPAYAGKLIQYGWETITEALKPSRHANKSLSPFAQSAIMVAEK